MSTILIIDDVADVAEAMAGMLSVGGFSTEIATSGVEGIEKANRLSPQLVICDMHMAPLSGVEVFCALRAGLNTNHIPVLMVSGSDIGVCDAIGDAQLRKPFFGDELLRVVEALIDSVPITSGIETRPD